MQRCWAEESSPNAEFAVFSEFFQICWYENIEHKACTCMHIQTHTPSLLPSLANSWFLFPLGNCLTLQKEGLHLSPVQSKITAFQPINLIFHLSNTPSGPSTRSFSLPLNLLPNESYISCAKNIVTYRHLSVRDFHCLIKKKWEQESKTWTALCSDHNYCPSFPSCLMICFCMIRKLITSPLFLEDW